MEQLKQAIIRQAEASWVDLIGFAGRERFEALDSQSNPFSMFPEGRTVILTGRRVTRGTLRGIEEGTNLADYGMFGRTWLNDTFLSQSTFDLVHLIERNGWDALPVMPEKAGGKAGFAPDFDYAAVACGLAEIGLSGQVLTPRFGPRQRWHMIITNAPLASDPLLVDPVCDQCGLCADLCPLMALDKNQIENRIICGKSMPVAACSIESCMICSNGVIGPCDPQGRPDRLAMFCSRTCIEHLNEAGKAQNHFRNAFRKRPAWRKDAEGRVLPALEASDAAAQQQRPD
jgi:ferredoxin